MLTIPPPHYEQITIECSQIKRFTNRIDAQAYQEANGGMVIHEQGKSIYYVMPEVSGVIQGSCYEEE